MRIYSDVRAGLLVPTAVRRSPGVQNQSRAHHFITSRRRREGHVLENVDDASCFLDGCCEMVPVWTPRGWGQFGEGRTFGLSSQLQGLLEGSGLRVGFRSGLVGMVRVRHCA